MTEGNESSHSNQDGKVDLDRILVEEIGEGKYQLQAIALCGMHTFLMGLSLNDFVFFAERVKTRCKIQECEDNDHTSFSPPWLANAVPAFGQSFDSCHRFAPSNAGNVSVHSCPPSLFNESSIIECTEFVYQHHNSAVYEFGLACDEWRWFLFGCSVLVGLMISLPLTGIIADRWGRRLALSMTAFNFTWINVTRYWVSSYNVFILITFLGSVCGSASVNICYLLALELVGSRRRMAVVSILSTLIILGSSVKGIVAWTQPHWRVLILILYSPLFISISYFWIAPESIRWLMNKNRFEEAKAILMKAATMNGRLLSDKTAKKISEVNSKSEVGYREMNILSLLFKHKVILLRYIVICIWQLSTALMTTGMVISSVGISGNKYVNFCAVTVITIPGFWISTFLINKIGRKPPLMGLFWLSGFCQLGYIFIPKGIHWVNLTLYMVAQSSAAAATITMLVYATEMFPTSHRSRLSGSSAIFGRIGGLIALLMPALADLVWEHLPQTLFSSLAFLCSMLMLLTPETLGASLPDTMEEAAQLGKDQSTRVRQLLRRLTVKKDCDRNGGVV